MVRRIVVLTVGLWALAGVSVCLAQDLVLLNDSAMAKLSAKAKPIYEEGAKDYDHVNYDAALQKFYEAMKADPTNIKLRFLVERFAYERGKMELGERSVQLFTMAQEALTDLVNRKDLKSEDRRRAEDDLKDVKRELDDVARRDTRREATGRLIIEEVTKERKEAKPLPPLGLGSPSEAAAEGAYNTPPEGTRTRAGATPTSSGSDGTVRRTR